MNRTRAVHAALPPAMREAVDRFARHLASERGRSPHTVRGYVADAVSLLDHAVRMGGTGPDDLDLGVLRSWLARLRSRKRQYETQHRTHPHHARRQFAGARGAGPGSAGLRVAGA